MELAFDRKSHREERLAFVRWYAAWVKRTPNREWSRQQAVLIDSYFENARNMPLSAREYLELLARSRRKNTGPLCEALDDSSSSNATD